MTARTRALARRALERVGLDTAAARRHAEQRLAEARDERTELKNKLRRQREVRDDQARVVDALTAQVDAMRVQQDLATGRDRDDLQYVFVVTYGRSGSTLLQGVLSTAPGLILRGENGGILLDLFHIHEVLSTHRERLGAVPLPPQHPWYGVDGYRPETAFRGFRTLLLDTVLRPEPDTRVIGFKEISWLPERVPEVLAFVRDVFPGARFVFNTRDLESVARSKWWARNPEAASELQTIEKQLADAVEPYGDDVYRVHFDDWVGDPTRLRGLFDWLGVEFDETRVREVMEIRHSY